MKNCGRCGLEKPDEDFAWRNKNEGLRDSYCRPCRAAYKRQHYAKNKQRYLDQAEAHQRIMVPQRNSLLLDYLKEHPCVDCGEDDVMVLEFDHLTDKKFDIGYGFRHLKWDAVLREIVKCEVVCVNCHRRRSAKRGGYLRMLIADEQHGA